MLEETGPGLLLLRGETFSKAHHQGISMHIGLAPGTGSTFSKKPAVCVRKDGGDPLTRTACREFVKLVAGCPEYFVVDKTTRSATDLS
jgi:hypothetical protein